VLAGRLGRVDLFLGERMPAEGGWPALLGGSVIQHEESPVLHLEADDWESYLASRSRNFREQVGRRERKLAREHELSYRLTGDPARLDDDLSTLFELHRARWSDARADAFAGKREAFHRDFAARALERGWLRLWFLELDGTPAAAWYGFRFAGADCFYQSGRDPKHESKSVGFVLMAHTIREAIGDGIREYRLLRGGEDYKARFSTEPGGVDTIAVPRDMRGRMALTAARAGARMPPAIRGALVRVAGRP